ncbi:Arc family DNA-binding protein [Komagataeibacter oboediens]|uniref:Arc family DNA-binding protein n=1 Tax=Komagataeibacter oboediens TaxID=65958 RepID=UPI001906F458|nr:Arc family DNA-binding protein [Komagataeibacter oboediens]
MTNRPPQIHFRLPAELKAWVEERAAESGRSVNAMLVQFIELVKLEYETHKAEEKSAALEKESEALRVALEALRIAKEARDMWQHNALNPHGTKPDKSKK